MGLVSHNSRGISGQNGDKCCFAIDGAVFMAYITGYLKIVSSSDISQFRREYRTALDDLVTNL